MNGEQERIRDVYARRKMADDSWTYSLLNPAVYMREQERERALYHWFANDLQVPVGSVRILEVGCGSGSNLLGLLRMGVKPHNLVGNEMLPDRLQAAREVTPAGVRLVEGDACDLPDDVGDFDVVYQSTVFTSILDPDIQQRLADRMWRCIRPGGFVLWYDFKYDNPMNREVRGIGRKRVRELFPFGGLKTRSLTLAPPIARRVVRWHPSAYTLFNATPLLRTHLLCSIHKPE
jgi:SAM-dependent methyltransferase